jgi:diguanylate cyclase (GGDEF)-like protein/PAS domain S-box-containing protein
MSNSMLLQPTPGKRRSRITKTDILTSPSLRLSVIHKDRVDVERSMEELAQAHYLVTAELVLSLEQFLSLTTSMQGETVAELVLKGATDCDRIDNMDKLPASFLNIRDGMRPNGQRYIGDGLHPSVAPYRDSTENPQGTCRCTSKGKLITVNKDLVKMLGWDSQEEILPGNLTSEIIRDPFKRQQLLGNLGLAGPTEALEVIWKRKDGSALKARLRGREVIGTNGRLRGYTIVAEDITQQRELERKLREQADKDALTGLDNDESLMNALDCEIRRTKRTRREFSLLLFALDDLKKINDRYGPAVGNKALCRLADAMSTGRRRIDISARLDGDKFALVLAETPLESAQLVAERICQALSNDVQEPKLSVSTGLASYPKDGEDAETLFAVAERVLHAMKEKAHGLDKPLLIEA